MRRMDCIRFDILSFQEHPETEHTKGKVEMQTGWDTILDYGGRMLA